MPKYYTNENVICVWIDHATKTHFFVSYVACSQSIHNIFIYKMPRNDEGRFNIKLYNA